MDAVTAVIVTRGDCDLTEALATIPIEWERLIWVNGSERWTWKLITLPPGEPATGLGPEPETSYVVPVDLRNDYGAYGRYAAIEYASGSVIYVQDDDCVVKTSDIMRLLDAYEPGLLTAMMPPERIDYRDTVLIGWGAIFDRELPEAAFRRWVETGHEMESREFRIVGADFVFPMLTRWKRLDGYHTDLPHAHADNRTWASFLNYGQVKEAFLREGRAIRDGR